MIMKLWFVVTVAATANLIYTSHREYVCNTCSPPKKNQRHQQKKRKKNSKKKKLIQASHDGLAWLWHTILRTKCLTIDRCVCDVMWCDVMLACYSTQFHIIIPNATNRPYFVANVDILQTNSMQYACVYIHFLFSIYIFLVPKTFSPVSLEINLTCLFSGKGKPRKRKRERMRKKESLMTVAEWMKNCSHLENYKLNRTLHCTYCVLAFMIIFILYCA